MTKSTNQYKFKNTLINYASISMDDTTENHNFIVLTLSKLDKENEVLTVKYEAKDPVPINAVLNIINQIHNIYFSAHIVNPSEGFNTFLNPFEGVIELRYNMYFNNLIFTHSVHVPDIVDITKSWIDDIFLEVESFYNKYSNLQVRDVIHNFNSGI